MHTQTLACTDEQDKTIMPPATLCWASRRHKKSYAGNNPPASRPLEPWKGKEGKGRKGKREGKGWGRGEYTLVP